MFFCAKEIIEIFLWRIITYSKFPADIACTLCNVIRVAMRKNSFLICSERICEREGQIFDPETDIPILIMELEA